MSKPIKLYVHPGGPNPWKPAIILEELGVPYETIMHNEFDTLKTEDFFNINPNGKVPAIEDPNTGFNVWESGAIVEYLLDTYDKDNKLSYTSGKEKVEQKCWLHFQVSGQGPYFGQRAWFILYHPEKNLTSCLDRYGNEIRRILSVIDTHLKKTGQPYLVGDKCTYADEAFMPWFWLLLSPPLIMGEKFPDEWKRDYPTCWEWMEKVMERPAVKKVREDRQKAIQAKQAKAK